MDEAHGVGHDGRLALAQLHHAARWIERGEELVLSPGDLRADQGVQEGRLARVRVADDADRGEQPAVPAPGRGRALLAYLVDPFLHLLDPLTDDPPVRFELALARAPRSDAAASAREVSPQAGEPRELVFELRQLDLEAALVRLGVLGEDVEDQPAAIDDLHVEERFECLLLGRRQLVVGHQQPEAGLVLGGDQVLGLALADVPVGIDMPSVLPLGTDDLGARGRSQGRQLTERFGRGPARVVARVDGDKEGFFDGRDELDHVSGTHGERRIARAVDRHANASTGQGRSVNPLQARANTPMLEVSDALRTRVRGPAADSGLPIARALGATPPDGAGLTR